VHPTPTTAGTGSATKGTTTPRFGGGGLGGALGGGGGGFPGGARAGG
jgi:hypothetical protein